MIYDIYIYIHIYTHIHTYIHTYVYHDIIYNDITFFTDCGRGTVGSLTFGALLLPRPQAPRRLAAESRRGISRAL